MQPLSASLEIAVGPQQARPEMSGGELAIVLHDCSDNATPRTLQARGVRFHGPARQAGISGGCRHPAYSVRRSHPTRRTSSTPGRASILPSRLESWP